MLAFVRRLRDELWAFGGCDSTDEGFGKNGDWLVVVPKRRDGEGVVGVTDSKGSVEDVGIGEVMVQRY
jgi:hypothetical protein